jgi:hypothetical protein
MAIGVYFHPKSLSAGMYDEAIRQIDAAGARQPAGRITTPASDPTAT